MIAGTQFFSDEAVDSAQLYKEISREMFRVMKRNSSRKNLWKQSLNPKNGLASHFTAEHYWLCSRMHASFSPQNVAFFSARCLWSLPIQARRKKMFRMPLRFFLCKRNMREATTASTRYSKSSNKSWEGADAIRSMPCLLVLHSEIAYPLCRGQHPFDISSRRWSLAYVKGCCSET